MADLEQPQPRGISRRTVTKAMAWTIPVVAIAAPAPAFAGASQGFISGFGQGCKLPGNSQSTYKGYAFRFQASNTTANPVTISITSVSLAGDNLGAFTVINLATCTAVGSTFTLQPGQSIGPLALLTAGSGNSQNGTLIVTYTVTGVPGTQTVVSQVDGSAPIQGNSCGAFTDAQKQCISNF